MHSLHNHHEALILRLVAKLTGLVVLATIVLLVFAAFRSTAFAAPMVQVRPEVKVAADVVKLGDVFVGVDEKHAANVLSPAPKAGETINWNAATLQKIALHFGLPYEPTPRDAAIISRASQTIPYADVSEAVIESLRAEGLDGRFDLQLNALMGQDWVVTGVDAKPVVEHINVDREKGTFRITLKAGAESLVSDGSIIPLIAVPTLRRSLAAGDRITDADLQYVDMKMKDLRKDVVLRADDLIGLTPRRALAVGATVKANDVVAPRLVKRGDMVPLIFKNARITLSTQGKAEEDGVLGGTVRVTNLNSKRAVEGRVGPNGEVIITN